MMRGDSGIDPLVFLTDPSLFTAPYDAALTSGLQAAGLRVRWLVRPSRPGEDAALPSSVVDVFFYRSLEGRTTGKRGKWWTALKGLSHVVACGRLIWKVARERPQVVHVQWAVLPLVDALTIRILQAFCPVVLTVHDTTPFNGERISWMQNMAFDLPVRWADRVIVHLPSARQTLIDRGIRPQAVRVIPHGPLGLAVPVPARPVSAGPWTMVLFGQLKPYKGLDILIEAAGLLSAEQRQGGRIVIAGGAFMDMAPLQARIRELALDAMIDLRIGRLSEAELAALFAEGDCFLFPYRQIDASGVYFLVSGLGKWLIASKVGIFAEDIADGENGRLVPPEDPARLAEALAEAIARRPIPGKASTRPDWAEIGGMTAALYDEVAREHRRA